MYPTAYGGVNGFPGKSEWVMSPMGVMGLIGLMGLMSRQEGEDKMVVGPGFEPGKGVSPADLQFARPPVFSCALMFACG
jgi:hypothetical protein